MTADPSAAPTTPAVDRAEFWRRSLRGWDVAFYALTATSAVAVLASSTGPTADAVAIAALVVMVVGYVTLGRRAALTGNARPARAYLAVLLVAVVVVVRAEPAGTVLLFTAYSQIWYFAVTRRQGVLLSVALAVGTTAAMAARVRAAGEDLLDLAGPSAAGLVFAVLLGLWITRVAQQSEERAELVDRLRAAQAALAEQHHAAGVTAERERMAQEIHDTLAQGFTSVVMLAQTAAADLDRGDDAAARERLGLVERTARDNLAEARALVAAFAPVALEGATLRQALERLAERFGAETGVAVDLRVGDPAGPLPRDVEVVLLRAAQEALANVRRHAHASRVLVRLDARDGTAELEVLDDGRGIAPGTEDGIGLRGMRERVAAGGGDVHVGAEPTGGTRVRVRVPAAPAAGEAAAQAAAGTATAAGAGAGAGPAAQAGVRAP